MRSILVVLSVMALAVAGSRVAVAQAPEIKGSAPIPLAEAGTKPVVRASSAVRRPPLKLPNIHRVTRELLSAERSSVQKQLVASRNVLRFWSNHKWILAPRKEKCWEVSWQRSCTVARHSLRLHTTLALTAKNRLGRMLPNTNDWGVALRIAQGPYPGTYRRGMQIADHEGSRGVWRWWGGSCSDPPCLWRGYHIGNDPWGDDTVGGNAQFRYSTFIVYWPAVVKDLKRRGFIIPDLGWARPYVVAGASTGYGPWLSPLGQALTLAYMHYYGKQGRHWNF